MSPFRRFVDAVLALFGLEGRDGGESDPEPAPEPSPPISSPLTAGDGDDLTLDVAVYTTQPTLEERGRIPEENVARFLGRALSSAGYNYRIEFGFGPVPGDFSSADGEANLRWSAMKQTHRGEHANLLLHHKKHNGISFGGGRYAIAPAGEVDRQVELVESADGPVYRNIRAALHEVGHLLGGKHSDVMIPAPHLLYQNVEAGWMDSPPP